MSYFLADATGPLDDFASIGGYADFRAWAVQQEGPVRAFVQKGFTEDLDELVEALQDIEPAENVREQHGLLIRYGKSAEDILIVSDGMSDDEEEPRAAVRYGENSIHAAADAYLAKLSVAIRYAFAMGRKAVGKGDASKAVKAVRTALLSVLPGMLLKVVTAGGEVGVAGLQKSRAAAGFDPNQPRDEQGQWTSGGGGIVLHGTAEEAVASILRSGLRVSESGKIFQDSKPGHIYLTTSEVLARTAAETAAEKVSRYAPSFPQYGQPGQLPAVLEVNVPANALARDKLLVDSYTHRGDVPASWIVGISIKTPEGWTRKELSHYRASESAATNFFAPWVLSAVDIKTLASPFRMRFDATNPVVVAWIKQHSAELVTQITDTSRERIRLAIEELAEEGDFVLATDRIMAAVGDADRANLIARHETMLAASEGQRQAWDQAVEKGLLPEDAKRVWITTGDGPPPGGKTCSICLSIEEKGAVGLNEPYVDEDGNEYDGPPAHVGDRCTEGITN